MIQKRQVITSNRIFTKRTLQDNVSSYLLGSLLFFLISILSTACSSSQIPPTPTVPSTPTPTVKNCGTVDTSRPQSPQDLQISQVVGVCFWKAVQSCQSSVKPCQITCVLAREECLWKVAQNCEVASFTYISSPLKTRVFMIEKHASGCVISDTIQQQGQGTAPSQNATTYICSQLQAFRGGNVELIFLGCGADGDITVFTNIDIQ